jgi:hypothetical protein
MKPQNTIGRFNPAFCGKVVRIVAAVCVLEFLATIALLMMWVPAASPCRAWHSSKGAPEPIYVLIIPVGLFTLWTCILAIFWKRFADLAAAQLRWDERQRASTGWFAALYRFLQPFQVNYTALLTVVFLGFVVFVAIPLVIIVQQCGP